MSSWLGGQARSFVIASGVSALFYIGCRLFGYQPDTLSLFIGIFQGAITVYALEGLK